DVIAEQEIFNAAINDVFIKASSFKEELSADCQVAGGELKESCTDAVRHVPHAEFGTGIRTSLEVIVPDIPRLNDPVAEAVETSQRCVDKRLGDEDIGIQEDQVRAISHLGAGIPGA